MRLRPEVQPQSFEDPQIAQITQISGSRGGWPQGSFSKGDPTQRSKLVPKGLSPTGPSGTTLRRSIEQTIVFLPDNFR